MQKSKLINVKLDLTIYKMNYCSNSKILTKSIGHTYTDWTTQPSLIVFRVLINECQNYLLLLNKSIIDIEFPYT